MQGKARGYPRLLNLWKLPETLKTFLPYLVLYSAQYSIVLFSDKIVSHSIRLQCNQSTIVVLPLYIRGVRLSKN